MSIDEHSVKQSPYITKMRGLITASLYHSGTLPKIFAKRLGYDINPPTKPTITPTKYTFENKAEGNLDSESNSQVVL